MTSSMKWHVERIPERDCWSVCNEAGFPVATGLPKHRAHYISAAPDLLEACEAVQDAEHLRSQPEYTRRYIAAMEAMRTAIAKARGVS